MQEFFEEAFVGELLDVVDRTKLVKNGHATRHAIHWRGTSPSPNAVAGMFPPPGSPIQ